MSGDNSRGRSANGDTSPDLRAQLAELLAAFDEIAQYGRERRQPQCDSTAEEASP